MDIQAEMKQKAEAAKRAAARLALLSTDVKNKALLAMADALEKRSEVILQANELDLEDARQKKVKRSYLDRLLLDEGRIASMAEGLRQTAALPDPVATGDYSTVRPNGLEIRRVRVPLGVIGIIYEARPNVTADAAALCLKAGNAVILRGGSEAIRSNIAISSLLAKAAYKAGIPEGAIQFVDFTDREAVDAMMHMRGYLDVIIPRGGAGLIKHVTENSSVPVIETGTGVCHTFVDASADQDMAIKIAVNAKVSRCSVCNAMETLLVHQDIAAEFLPKLVAAMTEKHVVLRGCERGPSARRWKRRRRRTGRRSTATSSSPCASSMTSRWPSSTSTATTRAIPKPLSRRTSGVLTASSAKSMQRPSTSTLRRASRTALSSALARRSASARRSFTRAARWASWR